VRLDAVLFATHVDVTPSAEDEQGQSREHEKTQENLDHRNTPQSLA
jgi:hypothetical protein